MSSQSLAKSDRVVHRTLPGVGREAHRALLRVCRVARSGAAIKILCEICSKFCRVLCWSVSLSYLFREALMLTTSTWTLLFANYFFFRLYYSTRLPATENRKRLEHNRIALWEATRAYIEMKNETCSFSYAVEATLFERRNCNTFIQVMHTISLYELRIKQDMKIVWLWLLANNTLYFRATAHKTKLTVRAFGERFQEWQAISLVSERL